MARLGEEGGTRVDSHRAETDGARTPVTVHVHNKLTVVDVECATRCFGFLIFHAKKPEVVCGGREDTRNSALLSVKLSVVLLEVSRFSDCNSLQVFCGDCVSSLAPDCILKNFAKKEEQDEEGRSIGRQAEQS